MKLDFPYDINIKNKNDAKKVLKNFCTNCPQYYNNCKKAIYMQCREVKKQIAEEYKISD